MDKEVELKVAKYVVFIDFGPDPFVRGYATLEDAEEELAATDYSGETYLVEVIKWRTAHRG